LGGPHQCIGNEFAMVEMQLIVAMVLRQFDPELAPDQVIRPQASIVLRPAGPVRVVLRPSGAEQIAQAGRRLEASTEFGNHWRPPG
jgi:hypothetical protein